MTDPVRAHSDMPDQHLVMRRPWWAPERSAHNYAEEPMDSLAGVVLPFDWTEQAACATSDLPPDAWFPNTTHRKRQTQLALRVCAGCPVRQHCLDYALGESRASRPLFGVWGGTTYHQRTAMTRPAREASKAKNTYREERSA